MPKWLSNILPYVSIPVIIAVGTIVYKSGQKSEQTVDKNDLVLYKVNSLAEMISGIKTKVDSMEVHQSDIKKAIIAMQREVKSGNTKINMKVDCIVENMPNNSNLIRQLYEIERAIERKNDTIDFLTLKNESLKKQYKIGAKKLEEDKW